VNNQVKSPQPTQLFDLEADLGEANNVAADHPEIIKRLTEKLERIRVGSDTRP